jgi:hypothetical protein
VKNGEPIRADIVERNQVPNRESTGKILRILKRANSHVRPIGDSGTEDTVSDKEAPERKLPKDSNRPCLVAARQWQSISPAIQKHKLEIIQEDEADKLDRAPLWKQDYQHTSHLPIINKLLKARGDHTLPQERFSEHVEVHLAPKKKVKQHLLITRKSLYFLTADTKKPAVLGEIPLKEIEQFIVTENSGVLCCLQNKQGEQIVIESFHRLRLASYLVAARKIEAIEPLKIYTHDFEEFPSPKAKVSVRVFSEEHFPNVQRIIQASPYFGFLEVSGLGYLGFQTWRRLFCVVCSMGILCFQNPDVLSQSLPNASRNQRPPRCSSTFWEGRSRSFLRSSTAEATSF